MIELRDVSVRYGTDESSPLALDGVDLRVDDGEVVCVLGPSGGGKSTLLRAVAGLEPLVSGTVLRDGEDLAGVPTHRRGLGLMFQDHALFPHRDVLANVAFGPRVHGDTDPASRAREALELVGLADFEARDVAELSGGEAQRVALARALAPAPRLLMLDEPLGSLDRELRDRLATELRNLFDRLDLGVLFVTHDHDEAFAIADRIVVLHAGRVRQVATPADLWRHPVDEFVARFLGWDVTVAFAASGAGDRHAVRPGGLHLVDARDGTEPTVRGTVRSRTFRRDHFVVTVLLDDGSHLRVDVRPDEVPDPGSVVTVAAPREALVAL